MPVFVDTGLNIAHVDDVAEGHVLAFEKGRVGERYVLGGENMGLRDILNVIAELTGGKPPLFGVPTGLIMPVAYVSEAWCRLTGGEKPMVAPDEVRMAKKKMFFRWDKAARELGYAPRPAREALADAVEWFRANNYIH